MVYSQIVSGRFIHRVNRFVAQVWVAGQEETVHVKNTGRCTELLLPGVEVWLEWVEKVGRKTRFSLIGVKKGQVLVNIDSQAPNTVAYEAIADGKLLELGGSRIQSIRREVTYGKSRFDLSFQGRRGPGFVEVKGVTLEQDGVALFPDAPTVRGVKHMRELAQAQAAGYEAVVLFVIQMKGVSCFRPHRDMDPDFAESVIQAAAAGVKVLAYDSQVTPTTLVLDRPVPVHLM